MILAVCCLTTSSVNADESRPALPASSLTGVELLTQQGVSHEEAVQLTSFFLSAGFSDVQLAKAHEILLKTKAEKLFLDLVIAKAHEGKAKQIGPDGILEAMERVRQRQLFAQTLAKKFSWEDERLQHLTTDFTSTLAAGVAKADLEKLIAFLLQQKAESKNQKLDDLASECCAVLRDLARMSYPSSEAVQVVVKALQEESPGNGVHALHRALHQATAAQSVEAILADFFKKPELTTTSEGAGAGSGSGGNGNGGNGNGNGNGNGGSGAGSGGNGGGSGGSGGGGGGGGGGGR